MTRYNKLSQYFIYIFLLLYLVLNIFFLTEFPFVHSDEPWLSGFSRKILEEKTFSTTENFFDLYPRNPHAIKIFFHTIQATVIQTLGYTIFSMRFISLIFGVLTLFIFYKLIHQLLDSIWLSIISVVMLSLDIQFIYASHFARQEIIILFILMAAMYINMVHLDALSLKHVMITGILISISIGIHPNSFVIAIPFGLLYLYQLATRRSSIKLPLLYIVLLSVSASIFIALSFSFNADYISDYQSYGSELGVTLSLLEKFTQLKYFLLKLYYGISGTYYTPNIRFQFVLFSLAYLASVYFCLQESHKHLRQKILFTFLAITGVLMGIVAIGRYNPTSVVFFFPLFYILIIYGLSKLKRNIQRPALFAIVFTLAFISITNILPYTKVSYANYLSNIEKTVPKASRVLANLNTEYHFKSKGLYDYRNLAYLEENQVSFDKYIQSHQIEYIIYPEEMDYIYNHRPLYNGMYGNLYPYYDDMQHFLNESCVLVDAFDSHYGMRIAKYFLTKKWQVKIYKVSP